jgi:hypothetical protein
MTTFINCTPHELTVEGLGTLQPSGIVPRCATERAILAPVGGVRIVRQKMGAVTGLPDAVEGVALIVSGAVLGALNGSRSDVFGPDTGLDAIRERGQVKSVLGLVQ